MTMPKAGLPSLHTYRPSNSLDKNGPYDYGSEDSMTQTREKRAYRDKRSDDDEDG